MKVHETYMFAYKLTFRQDLPIQYSKFILMNLSWKLDIYFNYMNCSSSSL